MPLPFWTVLTFVKRIVWFITQGVKMESGFIKLRTSFIHSVIHSCLPPSFVRFISFLLSFLPSFHNISFHFMSFNFNSFIHLIQFNSTQFNSIHSIQLSSIQLSSVRFSSIQIIQFHSIPFLYSIQCIHSFISINFNSFDFVHVIK